MQIFVLFIYRTSLFCSQAECLSVSRRGDEAGPSPVQTSIYQDSQGVETGLWKVRTLVHWTRTKVHYREGFYRESNQHSLSLTRTCFKTRIHVHMGIDVQIINWWEHGSMILCPHFEEKIFMCFQRLHKLRRFLLIWCPFFNRVFVFLLNYMYLYSRQLQRLGSFR